MLILLKFKRVIVNIKINKYVGIIYVNVYFFLIYVFCVILFVLDIFGLI